MESGPVRLDRSLGFSAACLTVLLVLLSKSLLSRLLGERRTAFLGTSSRFGWLRTGLHSSGEAPIFLSTVTCSLLLHLLFVDILGLSNFGSFNWQWERLGKVS